MDIVDSIIMAGAAASEAIAYIHERESVESELIPAYAD